MTDSSRPERLLSMLGQRPVTPDDADTAARRRARMLGAIDLSARVARRGRRQRRTVRTAMAGFALAASVALGVRLWWTAAEPAATVAAAVSVDAANKLSVARGEATVMHANGQHTTTSGELALAPSDLVALAPGARGRLSLEGARIELEAGAAARLGADPAREVELQRGRAGFEVSKRSAPASFSVLTRAARVVVVGTRFEVVVDGTGGTRTRVRVSEGRVRVEGRSGGVLLGPGEAWDSAETPTAQRDGTSEATTSASAASPPPARARVGPPAREATGPESTLNAELAEFERAMHAKRSGDDAAALARIEAFLQHRPKSRLAQEARVERFRLLARLGREGEAARAAREYMAEHPDGFARGEARDVAVKPPEPRP